MSAMKFIRTDFILIVITTLVFGSHPNSSLKQGGTDQALVGTGTAGATLPGWSMVSARSPRCPSTAWLIDLS
ncbi:hypothetical protein BJY00DRAFT_295320 [Aspergillus carlsbadensis]|nr:hypothetical protein BJY00DRAFT_295320 [Aspergillus carlsbadensis]